MATTTAGVKMKPLVTVVARPVFVDTLLILCPRPFYFLTFCPGLFPSSDLIVRLFASFIFVSLSWPRRCLPPPRPPRRL